MLGPLCDQTDKKMFFCKAQWRLKEICVFKQQPKEQPQKSHKQDILQKHHWSLLPTDACHELLCVFGDDFYVSGTQDAEVTKSLCSTFSQLVTVSFRQQQPHLHLPHCKQSVMNSQGILPCFYAAVVWLCSFLSASPPLLLAQVFWCVPQMILTCPLFHILQKMTSKQWVFIVFLSTSDHFYLDHGEVLKHVSQQGQKRGIYPDEIA